MIDFNELDSEDGRRTGSRRLAVRRQSPGSAPGEGIEHADTICDRDRSTRT